ncbi:MAG: inner-rane translocator [Conexibacter sp.]|jgi:ribose transport system permease protein|nr:inner-rane translocator [Conexibacter sp.]
MAEMHAPVDPAAAPGGPEHRPGRRRMQMSPNLYRLMIELCGIGSFYLIVVAYFSAQAPEFLTSETAQTILAGATVLAIVAIGQTYVIISGGFDLSVGGVVPLGAVVYGTMLNRSSLVVALICAIAVGAAIGLINGAVVARFKVNPLIGTLAMLSIAGGLAYVISDGETLPIDHPQAGLWGNTELLGLQNGTLAVIGLAVVAAIVLRYTVYGRALYTVGGNREAAVLAGLRAEALGASVYLVSGACAAIGGVILTSQLLASSPGAGSDTTLNSVAAVVLGGASLAGGVGGITGTILGVLLLGTTSAGMGLLQVPTFYQTIVTGGVLLVAVGFGRVREILLARSIQIQADH